MCQALFEMPGSQQQREEMMPLLRWFLYARSELHKFWVMISLWGPITEWGGGQNLAIGKGFLMFSDKKLVQNQKHYQSEVLPAEPTHVALCDITKPEHWGYALSIL